MLYRRNSADTNFQELRRRWAQDGDEAAGKQLQIWKYRTHPIDLEDVAYWLHHYAPRYQVYLFNGEIYCEDCGKASQQTISASIFKELTEAGYAHVLPEVACNNTLCNYRAPITEAEIDQHGNYICGEECSWPSVTIDEYSYDSDMYPKVVQNLGASDNPDHCSSEQCVNAFQIGWGPGGEPDEVGALLGRELTAEGVDYIIEAISEPKPTRLSRVWALYFSDNYPEIKNALKERERRQRNNPYEVRF